MSFVLDANVVISVLLDEESSTLAKSIRTALATEGGVVPQHMILEVITAVLRAGRTGRIPAAAVSSSMRALAIIFNGLDVDPATNAVAIAETFPLAQRHQLSAYDAAYLELAQRRGVPLATLDDRLIEAAGAESVPLVGAG